MKLNETLKGLICEVASIDTIIDAIKNKKICIIYYDGDEPGGKGLRQIEPVCLGVSKAGNKVLRAWDEEGASHRGYLGTRPLPGWRMFRLDRIKTFTVLDERFTEPKPKFNPNGDKDMIKIYTLASF